LNSGIDPFFQNQWNNVSQFFCPKTRAGKWECPEIWINVFDERYTGMRGREGEGGKRGGGKRRWKGRRAEGGGEGKGKEREGEGRARQRETLATTDIRKTEGDAWHYRFYVPGDIHELIQLFGGPKNFVDQLQEFIGRAEWDPTTALPNPYYWVGNEVRFLNFFKPIGV
jgi:hypothetical protein